MKKKHLREIERINKTIPKELLEQLTKKELQFPAIKEVVTRAINDAVEEQVEIPIKFKWWDYRTWDRFKKRKYKTRWMVDGKIFDKPRYQALLISGELDKEIEVINHDIEKQIDDYLEKEFEKARKLGRLPPPQKTPTLITKAKKELYANN